MGKMPTVTVVIPVYNVALYVERCVLSVMRQSYPATECIIVDDISTDDSNARCQHLIDEYKGDTRFTIIHHDRNRGLSAARNTGTNAATSDYIYYLDSDDEITPNCMVKLVAPVIQDDSVEMVMGDFRRDFSAMTDSNCIQKPETEPFMDDTPSELYGNEEIQRWFYQGKCSRPIYVWNKLLKTSFVKENHLYNREGLLWEDGLWSFYLMRSLSHVAFVHDVTYLHHVRPESITTSARNGERTRYYGYTLREIADRINPREKRSEAAYWVMQYSNLSINVAWDSNYLYAYRIYLRKMLEARLYSMAVLLSLTHNMSKSWIGRTLLKAGKGGRRMIKRLNRGLWK